MAHSHDTTAGHPAMDYAEHERTYEMFVGMAKWGVILGSLTLALMAWALI